MDKHNIETHSTIIAISKNHSDKAYLRNQQLPGDDIRIWYFSEHNTFEQRMLLVIVDADQP